MDYTLAIDQGTHASRALLLDEQGRTLASHLLEVDLVRPQTDHAEQDGDQIHTSVTAAIERVLHTLPRDALRHVTACGLSTQRSSVTAWQGNGALCAKLLSWQDTRGAAQITRLIPHRSEIQKISGLALSPHYGASKLHWLHQLLDQPPGLRLGPLASFLLDRVTGRSDSGIDHSNAQRMQLFDIHRLSWSTQLCDWFEVPMQLLPACKPVIADHGRLEFFDIPVKAVCGDQNAAWFTDGRPPANGAHINMGSGAFVLAPLADDSAPEGLLTSIAFSDSSTCDYLVEGTVNGAGSALEWLQVQHNIPRIHTRLADWLQQVRNPPLFLNTIGGLGSPWWRHDAAPCFIPAADGLSEGELAVAVAESILFLLQYNLEQILTQQSIDEIRLSGGLARVTPLCQKLADLSSLPVRRCADPEASARGVAWLAAGQPDHWLASETPTRLFQPQADKALQTRYHAFIEALTQHVQTSRE